jgi:F0F1-type ATP synthase delta subunit
MAVPVDDQIAGRLKQLIAGDGARDVELEVRQDPAIIGGFTLEVDMNILDASVAARLKRVRKTLGIIK